MSDAPSPTEIFERAAREGRRRLGQSVLELSATGFIAGFTIVLGILAMAATHAAAEPTLGPAAKVPAALAFATGLVMLIVQRAELFSENFFDPVASGFRQRQRGFARALMRLWGLTLLFNLLGGGLMAWLTSLAGVVPQDSADALRTSAEALAARPAPAAFVSAIVGGVLVALLSYALAGADGVLARIAMALVVGFLLAIGPFDHVVVTVLHLFMGLRAGAAVDAPTLAEGCAIATAGNLLGGVGLVASSHAAQVRGRKSS